MPGATFTSGEETPVPLGASACADARAALQILLTADTALYFGSGGCWKVLLLGVLLGGGLWDHPPGRN
jgi:hypothetical protein